MSRGAIVLTGATGVVGMEVLARLLAAGDRDVVVLLRAADGDEADRRLQRTLERLWDVPPAGLRVRAIPADVTSPRLGLGRAARRELADCADAVVHCAAAVGFDQRLEDALAVNALGTQRVLELAHDLPRLRRMVHVSTAYVSGRHEGRFGEDDLQVGQSFRNAYEQSKHLAERLVAASRLPVVVARPSIVVGHAETGWTPAFSALYLPLRAFARGLLEQIPGVPDGVVDAVSLDYVGAAIAHLVDAPGVDGATLNLVAGDAAATVADVVRLGAEHFLAEAPPIAPLRQRGAPDALVPYFDVRTTFDDACARAVLGPAGIRATPLDAMFSRLMEFAETTCWGREPMTREAAARREITMPAAA